MAFCVNCGAKLDEGIKFCLSCGNAVSNVPNEPVAPMVQQQTAPLPPRPMADEMYCHSCGSVIKKIAEICPKCGVKQGPADKKNTLLLISAIIGSVLGGFMFGLMVGFMVFDKSRSEFSSVSDVMFFIIFFVIPLITSILTYIAWVKSNRVCALVGGILHIITITGIVSGILNLIACGQLKEKARR
jgi:uncharacterized membrane protein YvbJ